MKIKVKNATTSAPQIPEQALIAVLFALQVVFFASKNVNSDSKGAMQLNAGNLDMTLGKASSNWPIQFFLMLSFLASNELVFINFYAEWCRFSNMLQPIFDEAADKACETWLAQRTKLIVILIDFRWGSCFPMPAG